MKSGEKKGNEHECSRQLNLSNYDVKCALSEDLRIWHAESNIPELILSYSELPIICWNGTPTIMQQFI